MTFFNKKEEVLDVKLTPYGRYLLSIGKLRPAYYCFIDDDVVYDVASIGETEAQNQSHQRIVNETPKLKPIPSVFSANKSFGAMESEDTTIDSIRQERNVSKVNRNYSYLGTNSHSSERSSTFHVSALNGEFASSALYYTASVNSVGVQTQSETINIPQLNMTPKYEIKTHKLSFGETQPDFFEGEMSTVFSDNTYFSVSPENPLLFFKEFNSFNHLKNYDIEVFELTEADGTGEISYKPLKFRKKYDIVVNDMIVDEVVSDRYEEVITSDFVEYYFNIFVDKEIANEDICAAIGRVEIHDIFVDEEIDCPDLATESFDIYGTNITDSDLEDCD